MNSRNLLQLYTMKTLPRLIALSVALLPFSAWAQPKTPDEFLSSFRAAIQEKSPEKLDAITYGVGMSDSDKQQVAMVQKMIFQNREIAGISLEPLPEDFETVFIARGKKYEPTYPPAGLVKIQYQTNGNGVNTTSSPYAIIDGCYFLISSKSTDLGWQGPPDKTITFMVMGRGQDKVQIRAKWNASGVDQEQNIKSPSFNVVGQYFDTIAVASNGDDTDVTLTVMDAGKQIYVSKPLKGKGSIEYKKGD